MIEVGRFSHQTAFIGKRFNGWNLCGGRVCRPPEPEGACSDGLSLSVVPGENGQRGSGLNPPSGEA